MSYDSEAQYMELCPTTSVNT